MDPKISNTANDLVPLIFPLIYSPRPRFYNWVPNPLQKRQSNPCYSYEPALIFAGCLTQTVSNWCKQTLSTPGSRNIGKVRGPSRDVKGESITTRCNAGNPDEIHTRGVDRRPVPNALALHTGIVKLRHPTRRRTSPRCCHAAAFMRPTYVENRRRGCQVTEAS